MVRYCTSAPCRRTKAAPGSPARLPAIVLVNPLARHYPAVLEPAQIEALVRSLADEFAQGATHCGRLLHPVTGQAGSQIDILEFAEAADDEVLVEQIEVVMTTPTTNDLDRFECREVLRQRRPYDVFEQAVIHVVFEGWRIALRRRRHGSQKPAALGAERDTVGRDGQRRFTHT